MYQGVVMTSLSRMTEYTDRRVWDLDGYEVTYLHIDYRFAFDCTRYVDGEADDSLCVIVETPFTLRTSSGEEEHFNPSDALTLGGALAILHKSITSLTAYRNGCLQIVFTDGMELLVTKNPQYESWEAHGGGELEIALLCSGHDGPPWSE
jgi:hypothetical protein